MKHFFKYFIIVLLAMSACGEDDYQKPDIGLSYFPLSVGSFWIYHVDETEHNEVAGTQEFHYQLRVEVADSSRNTDGTFTYLLYRYKRTDDTSPWEALDTWSARKTDHELIVTEGNIAYQKLIFPMREGLQWDGNAYNDRGEDEYKIEELDASYDVSATTYEHAAIVNQEDNDDFIVFLDQRKEVYAKDVGLIYREIVQLEYCTAENCIGQQQVQSGTEFKQELIAYEIQ